MSLYEGVTESKAQRGARYTNNKRNKENTMKANTKNNGAKNSNKAGNGSKGANKAKKAAAVEQAAAVAEAVAEVKQATGAVVVRVLAENLAGETLDGKLETTIKRHTLKGESKCGMVKRLLMEAGMTKEKLVALVEAKHGELKETTLNTIRADLKRTLGTGDIACKGWRTDGKAGKMATAAVAKLRTHVLGVSAYAAGLVTVETKKEETSAE